jgi:TetR/AcrR family transcriptional regulator, cholesterol catabolism regulator
VSASLLADGGPEKLFGITVAYAAKQKVIAEFEIEPDYLTDDGAVSGSVIMALAECANTPGAELNVPERSTTIQSNTHLLSRGRGSALRAEAAPLHIGNCDSVWRAVVFRNDEGIAEVVQTYAAVAGRELVAPKPGDRAEPRRKSPGEGPLSEGFSRDLVDERWKRIVEGASKIVAVKGFSKATIREIAAAADMPVATMYQYLTRKEDILYNVYKHFMGDIMTVLARWRSNGLPPRERLTGAIRTIIDVFDEKHRFIKLMFQETRSLTPEARREVYALDAQFSVFRDLLADCMHHGEIRVRNVELAANFIYFLRTICPLRFWSIGKYGEKAAANEIIDFVLHGLGEGEPVRDVTT